MAKRQWRTRPALDYPREGVYLGPGSTTGDGFWLGTLAESVTGTTPAVWVNTNKEQVLAVVGKRGSGKSFTLGVIVEGLSAPADSTLSKQSSPRGVLLFDPLDVYWTLRFPVSDSENAEAKRHFKMARASNISPETYAVTGWVPGERNSRPSDPDWFQTLQLPVPELAVDEWELLLGVDPATSPMGQALSDAVNLVRETGYTRSGDTVDPLTKFDLTEIVDAVNSDQLELDYHPETLRALRQRLNSLSRTGLFASRGTSIRDLVEPGSASVIMLGRLSQSYRTVVVAVLTRMLMRERSETAFAEKRLVLDPELSESDKKSLRSLIEVGVPRTVVILDEAQSFLAPGKGNSARDLFVKLVKEGRNMGLSAVLATQQPSALDQRVLSQVETFIAHQLVTESDIRALKDNLKSELPESIKYGQQLLEGSAFLRQLPPGYCLISAADLNTVNHRSLIAVIRPRATVHGGIEL